MLLCFHRSRYDAQKMVGAMIDGEYRFVPPSCTGDPNCLPDCAADPLRCEFDALDVKDAKASLASGKIDVAGVTLAAGEQVFFTLGALLAANKTPL